MKPAVRIGVIGDFNPEFHTHPAITAALHHSGAKLGIELDVEWVPTPSLQHAGSETTLQRFDAVFAAPGGPYRSFDGMLRGIEFARARHWPFFAT